MKPIRTVEIIKEVIQENLEEILQDMVEDEEINHYSMSIDKSNPKKIFINAGINEKKVLITIAG